MAKDKLSGLLGKVDESKVGLARALGKALKTGKDRISDEESEESSATCRALFQSPKAVGAPVQQSEPIAQGSQAAPVQQLQEFIQSLRSIGANYTGHNQKRKDAIERIQTLVSDQAPKENASKAEVIRFAKEIRGVLAEVTKDHHKGFNGFLAYLFGKKSRLEKLISNCFQPLVAAGLFRQTKAGVEAIESERRTKSARFAAP